MGILSGIKQRIKDNRQERVDKNKFLAEVETKAKVKRRAAFEKEALKQASIKGKQMAVKKAEGGSSLRRFAQIAGQIGSNWQNNDPMGTDKFLGSLSIGSGSTSKKKTTKKKSRKKS